MLQSRHAQGADGKDDVRCDRKQFRRVFTMAVDIVLTPADVDPHIATIGSSPIVVGLVGILRDGPDSQGRSRLDSSGHRCALAW
jgi:hypothetical protein